MLLISGTSYSVCATVALLLIYMLLFTFYLCVVVKREGVHKCL